MPAITPPPRLLVLVFVTALAAGGTGALAQVDSLTDIGVAPSHVNGTSLDPLFVSYPEWSTVVGQIDFFKYYGCMYSWCGPLDTAGMVAFMDQHDVAIACEYGDFPSGDDAAYNFGIAELQIDPVFDAGGHVSAIHLDGPIRRLLLIASPTVGLEQAADEIVEFWGLCRARYPDTRIGLITNLPNWDYTPELHGYQPYPNYTDQSGVYYLDALNTVHAALIDAGHALDFLEVDCPYQYYAATRTHDNDADVDNPAKFRHIRDWCRDRGVAFHLVANAEPGSQAAHFKTGTISYVNRLIQDGIFPDALTVQSWYTLPTQNLPEWTSYTFMNAARDVIALYVANAPTGVRDAMSVPGAPRLAVATPNPFNPSTTIVFGVPRDMRVRLRVFDLHGRPVTTLAEGVFPAGDHVLTWDGRDRQGRNAASAVYVCRLEAGDTILSEKMVLVR